MPRYGMAFPPNNRMWYERPIGTGYALSLAGGTMEGPVYLWREPRYPTEAASKAYVDFAVGNTGGPFLGINGGHMRGPLLLMQDPVSLSEAATRNYVDRSITRAMLGTRDGLTLYKPGGSDPLVIMADGQVNQTFARVIFNISNTGSGAYAWSAGATPAGHFEIRDNTLGINPLTIWGGRPGDPNTGNVYINNGDLVCNHTNPGSFSRIRFQGPGHNWYVGGTPGQHFEIRDDTKGINPLTIWGGGNGDPNAGNVYINNGALTVGDPTTISATGRGTVNAHGYYVNGVDLVARIAALEQWVETH